MLAYILYRYIHLLYLYGASPFITKRAYEYYESSVRRRTIIKIVIIIRINNVLRACIHIIILLYIYSFILNVYNMTIYWPPQFPNTVASSYYCIHITEPT